MPCDVTADSRALRPSSPAEGPMLDRQKVEAVLVRRFPGSSLYQVAAAANAIMGLDDEWEEIFDRELHLGLHHSAPCGDGCCLVHAHGGTDIRLFRRRRR